jgi:hypothetical protein
MGKTWRSKGGAFIKELFYFSSCDVMVQVSYKSYHNSIRYSSHRELSLGERVIVEQYLLTKVAVKTEYYQKPSSMLNYIGIDVNLAKELNRFHPKNSMSSLNEKEAKIKASVKKLIDQSLANYYFEQIGNTLIEIRRLPVSLEQRMLMNEYVAKLKELVEAYNLHAENKVSVDEIVPQELRGYMI